MGQSLPFLLLLVVSHVVLVYVSPRCAQGEELVLDDYLLIQYANSLYENQEYYRAISEFKRFEYFFPESPFLPSAQMQIGRSYMAGGEARSALEYWQEKIQEKEPSHDNFFQIQRLMGITWLDIDQHKTYTLRQTNIENAVRLFESVDEQSPGGTALHQFAHDWRNPIEMENKSPVLAGIFSAILPGVGSIYADHPREGIYAFFITGLFFWATQDAIRRKDAGLTYVFGFFTIAFYSGNIYTAVNSAYKYNDQQKSNYLVELRNEYNLWFHP